MEQSEPEPELLDDLVRCLNCGAVQDNWLSDSAWPMPCVVCEKVYGLYFYGGYANRVSKQPVFVHT